MNRKSLSVLLGLFIFTFQMCLYSSQQSVTKEDVINVQKEWGNAIVAIGKSYTDNKNNCSPFFYSL